eukprot:12892726-Prorocentrum_lima.AAC.1
MRNHEQAVSLGSFRQGHSPITVGFPHMATCLRRFSGETALTEDPGINVVKFMTRVVFGRERPYR